ncbi:hypothetical protein A0U89_14870 (plasmid) [Kozakia baliensis]|uniref:Uncharacterized protein n=2 Tax=Kozakia baliensis TaxID=153496 RepID=A0A1D8UXY8_9PROT|nr:hypothetical protein A0U89_14870 [Kozakia baliensis]
MKNFALSTKKMHGRMMEGDDRIEGVSIMDAFLRYPRTPRRTPRERLAAHFRHATGTCLLRDAGALVGVIVQPAAPHETLAVRPPTHPAPGMPV